MFKRWRAKKRNKQIKSAILTVTPFGFIAVVLRLSR